jgi:hypothetical protein
MEHVLSELLVATLDAYAESFAVRGFQSTANLIIKGFGP